MAIKKHIGRIKNTGTTVVVVMQEIPGREDDALIVEVDSMPPKYQDSFADLVNKEAQNTHEDLASLLNRRLFPSGGIMLQTLHKEGYLKPMPKSNISMIVNERQTIPLEDLVAAIKGDEPKATPDPEQIPLDLTPTEPNLEGLTAEQRADRVRKQLQMLEESKEGYLEGVKKNMEALEKDLDFFREKLDSLEAEVKASEAPKKRTRRQTTKG